MTKLVQELYVGLCLSLTVELYSRIYISISVTFCQQNKVSREYHGWYMDCVTGVFTHVENFSGMWENFLHKEKHSRKGECFR